MSVRDDRRAFRRRLGITLGRVRTKLTTYTQATIAETLGADTETVGRWERGEREPKVFDLHRLWAAYGIPGDWFLDPTDSLTELDRRIDGLRLARLREGAVAAAQAAEEAEPYRPDDGGPAAAPGKRPGRKPPRSPR